MKTELKLIVKKALKQNRMITPEDRVGVALSGGADSVALLMVLKELSEELSFRLFAIHVDHGIRGAESEADALFCQTLCENLGIPVFVQKVNVPEFAKKNRMGMEEAARILRYEVFDRISAEQKISKIALAHHANDQAETMLFRLARGTGLQGLGGMLPVRDCYIRPMLYATREEIEAYLIKRDQPYCRDATNDDLIYARNLIRAKIIPELSEVNSCAVRHFAQAAAELQNEEDYMRRQAAHAYSIMVKETRCIQIDALRLRECHSAIAARVIRQAAEQCGAIKDISRAHIEAIMELAEKPQGKRVEIPGGITAFREAAGITLKPTALVRSVRDEETSKFQGDGERDCAGGGEQWENISVPLEKSGELVYADSWKIVLKTREFCDLERSKKSCTKCIDYDIIKFGFTLRRHQPGDYFLLKTGSGRKTVSRELIDQKVPAGYRKDVCVIAKGSHVYAVLPCIACGYDGRVAEDAWITEKTKQVVCVEPVEYY